MGAQFCTMSVPASLSRQQIKDKFLDAQDQDRYENGHSYSGGFGMATGLMFCDEMFMSAADAESYLQDACIKWEEARAVKYRNMDNTESYLIGALCAS